MLNTPSRDVVASHIMNQSNLGGFGLTAEMIASAITYTYQVLDAIDQRTAEFGEPRLSQLLELANLSSVVGNLFGRGLARASDGRFERNKPHHYPDLLALKRQCEDFEVKVALETKKPKGHLAKPGPHLTLRYVLGGAAGQYARGKNERGDVVWIWEVRVGRLEQQHFNLSNTPGDSGKTAVINAAGMSQLAIVYVDLDRCPHSPIGKTHKAMKLIVDQHFAGPMPKPLQ